MVEQWVESKTNMKEKLIIAVWDFVFVFSCISFLSLKRAGLMLH